MTGAGHPDAEAWHEAGHAVVARLLGGRVLALTLEDEDEDLDGRATIEWRDLDARGSATASGRVALGGPLAELAFLGESAVDDPEVLSTWRADWDEVERCAAEFEPDAARRVEVLRHWIAEVQRLIDDPRVSESIARVADALDAHGTLDETLFEDCFSA